MISPQVIDLSHYNVLPTGEIASPGLVGVIHKATQGVTYSDSKLAARYSIARQAGLLWGVYHFLTKGKLEAQLANFSTVIGTAGVLDDSTLIAVDHEDTASLDELRTFLILCEKEFHRRPVLYSGHLLKEQLATVTTTDLSHYRLWLSQYGASPTLPRGFLSYWLWQYSDVGQVPGVNGNCDCSVFQGPAPSVIEWSGHSPSSISATTIRLQVPKGTKVIVDEV